MTTVDDAPTGVCVIRVEILGNGLLLTVRTNPDIERLTTDEVQRMTDVQSVMRVVTDFLAGFAARPQEGCRQTR